MLKKLLFVVGFTAAAFIVGHFGYTTRSFFFRPPDDVETVRKGALRAGIFSMLVALLLGIWILIS